MEYQVFSAYIEHSSFDYRKLSFGSDEEFEKYMGERLALVLSQGDNVLKLRILSRDRQFARTITINIHRKNEAAAAVKQGE